jgi:two-component system sensor histidine kinase RegB
MGHDHLALHLEGMWIAFGLAAGFIVYFVQRVTRALARRDQELADARAVALRAERLASLATLAAGAAHELSTPLSTIAVVTRELELELTRLSAGDPAIGDIRLIREQVERCRAILIQLAADAGESTGEDFTRFTIDLLVDEAMRGLSDAGRVRVSIARSMHEVELLLPLRAVAQALRAVVKNALQASPPDRDVVLHAEHTGSEWAIGVSDHGAGMTPDVLTRAFEPFFTTKPMGRGMGLGLFLARDVLQRVGGRVELRSESGAGTTASIWLPAAPVRANERRPAGKAAA